MQPLYHGSMTPLAPGLILQGRGAAYDADWTQLIHYAAFETHRPTDALAHRDAVFMCDDIDVIDACGGGTEFVCLLEPLGPVTRHDLDWSGVVSCFLDDTDDIHDPRIVEATLKYWAGTPGVDPVWEFITPKARVLACCPFDDINAAHILARDAGLVPA